MKLSKIIGLASAALAVYFYKQNEVIRDDIAREREDHARYIEELLSENNDLEDKINPNGNANQAPVVFSVTMRSGGQMLEQNEIILNCTNTSNSVIEIGDFRANIWLAGIKSDLCYPANIGSVKIPKKGTVSFRLYAKYGKLFRDYVDVKRALNILYDGRNTPTMRKETFIPISKLPVLMNLQYLWYWSGGSEECMVYDIPGNFRWKYAGWTVGKYVGYNAANENDQKKNPSYWQKYDEQPIDSENE